MTGKQHADEGLGKFLSLTAKYGIWPILWLFYFLLIVNVNYKFALFQATLFVITQLTVVQVNLHKLLPYYDQEERNKKYIRVGLVLVLAISIAATLIDWAVVEYFIPKRHADDEKRGVAAWLFPLFLHFMVNGFAFFVSTSNALNERAQTNLMRIKELERSQIDTELRFLKTQINPHFLFNALNNIYTISYMGEEQAPEKILELSEMLRYVLYDCKGDSVPIEKEIAYIRNYIDFQQLKTEEKQRIELNVEGLLPSTPVAPMLLIPFVENSFKHSKIDKEKDAFVRIDIQQKASELKIEFTNSIPSVKAAKWLNSEGGIGLENVKKRLDLLYPKHYLLQIEQENGEFRVLLKIDIQQTQKP